jgi:hypothetical protein
VELINSLGIRLVLLESQLNMPSAKNQRLSPPSAIVIANKTHAKAQLPQQFFQRVLNLVVRRAKSQKKGRLIIASMNLPTFRGAADNV